jgi:hypothetical protein
VPLLVKTQGKDTTSEKLKFLKGSEGISRFNAYKFIKKIAWGLQIPKDFVPLSS